MNVQARMRHLLSQMRNPQARLKVVHIAGTKGKGSTAAMLSSILHHSGLKVGTYTRCIFGMNNSPECLIVPHLIDTTHEAAGLTSITSKVPTSQLL